MLSLIQRHQFEEKNLFFFNNMFLHKNCIKEISNKKELLKTVSFHTTWIANFGIWNIYFKNIQNKNHFVKTQFLQVSWFYQIVENRKKSIVYFDDWVHAKDIKKGGYNLFDTFVNKYLWLIKQIGFPLYDYKVEKFELFHNFIFYFYKRLFILKGRYTFETKKGHWIIFKKYWYEPYFFFIPLIIIYKLLLKIKQKIIVLVSKIL